MKEVKVTQVEVVFCDNGVYIEYRNDIGDYAQHKEVFLTLEDALTRVSAIHKEFS